MSKTATLLVRPQGAGETPCSATPRRPRTLWGRPRFRGIALALASLILPAPALAADSLATPITVQSADALWPLEVEVTIVPVDAADAGTLDGDAPARGRSEITRKVVVPDGLEVVLSEGLQTPRGKRRFEVKVVARHHPGHTVEIEWDLRVDEAEYRPLSWDKYLLHRLQLAEAAQLGDSLLKVARSDIVSTHGEPLRKQITLGEDAYEIRIMARSMRG